MTYSRVRVLAQRSPLCEGPLGKRLTYEKLIEPNGRESGARPLGGKKMD